MGVKDLWSILTPFCERKPLYELQGKTVAVDLSCWVCEAKNISEYQVQPRMYLRNLYFRTCFLLLMEVNPIFVLEGKAPTLKYDTIAARNAIQFKGAAPKKDGVKTGKDRTRFHYTLKQCEEMLQYMGLACITGKGEAEAMCAYLNEDGKVSGCISQDSDCFAYGARVVYRNFSISQQGAFSATGGAVDVYDLQKAYNAIGFGRNKVVALALLAGSDYSEGVMGIGKDSAVKFFENIPDDQVLDRIRKWKTNNSLYEEFYKTISNKNLCTSCGHSGKIQGHTKSGCIECRTTKGCDFTKFKEERLAIKNELNIRSKALMDPSFPNEELINEFLVRKDTVDKFNLNWKQPDMVKFVKFTTKYLTWEEIYGFEKLLPILTRWQLMNPKIYEVDQKALKGILYPDCIKKIRNPKGVPSYEIKWIDKENYFQGLIPEEQLNDVDPIKLWSTIEPQHLVERAFPELVEAFKQSKIKPKKPSKRKQKPVTEVDELGNFLANVSISEPKQKRKPRKPKEDKGATKVPEKSEKLKKNKKMLKNVQQKKSNEDLENLESSFTEMNIVESNQQTKELKTKIPKPKTRTIDSYFKKAVLNNAERTLQNGDLKEDPLKNVDEPKNTLRVRCSSFNSSFDLDVSKFGDEDDLDISDVIEDIIARDPFKHIREKVFKLDANFISNDLIESDNDLPAIYEGISDAHCHQEKDASLHENNESLLETYESPKKRFNTSSFFMTNMEEDDLFEKTFNKKYDCLSSDTEEYEFDFDGINSQTKVDGGLDNQEELKKQHMGEQNVDHQMKKYCDNFSDNSFNDDNCSNDSFSENYVPLLERVRGHLKN